MVEDLGALKVAGRSLIRGDAKGRTFKGLAMMGMEVLMEVSFNVAVRLQPSLRQQEHER